MKSKNSSIRNLLLIFGLILSISVISTRLQSQNISTVGEIYDYEIGDIFHVDHINTGAGFSNHSITNIEILDKYYSQNNDTLFYIRDIDYKSISSPGPGSEWYYQFYIDTIIYNNLDSLIEINVFQIDSVGTNTDLYNGRLINYGKDMPQPWMNFYWFVKGCGLAFLNHTKVTSGIDHTNLVYYKKGDEEWGDQVLVSIRDTESTDLDLIVFPNPTKSTLNISANDAEIIDLKIIAMSGELVRSTKLSAELNTIDISELRNGIYILEIRKKDRIIYKKIIKE